MRPNFHRGVLVAYLRSDAPLERDERDGLADLIGGLMVALGKPPEMQKQRAWYDVLAAVVERTKKYKTEGVRRTIKAIEEEIASEWRVDPIELARRRKKSRR